MSDHPLLLHANIFKQSETKRYKCMFLSTLFLIAHNREKWDEITGWCREQFGPPAEGLDDDRPEFTWCLDETAVLFTDLAQGTAFKVRWM